MRRLYGSTLAGLCLLISVSASGQSLSAASAAPATDIVAEPALRQELPNEAVDIEGLIRLDVSVTDQSGKPIEGLKREDFKLTENGTPQSVVAFRASRQAAAGGDDALKLIVFLDTIGLAGSTEEHERQQIADFLRQNGGKLAQSVTIYSLENSGFFLTGGPSLDGESLARAVVADDKAEKIYLAPEDLCRRGDNDFLLVPAMTGLEMLATIAVREVSQPGRKLILWIGPQFGGTGAGAFIADGEALLTSSPPANCPHVMPPSYSLFGPHEREHRAYLFSKILWFSALLRQARVTVDTLSEDDSEPGHTEWQKFLDSPSSPQEAHWMSLYKNVLAVQSGGHVLRFSKNMVLQIENAVDSEEKYYSLTFEPLPAQSEEYHSLKIDVSRPELTVRTRTGYYDEPYYEDLPAPKIQQVTVAQLGATLAHRSFPALVLTERLNPADLRNILDQFQLHVREHSLDYLVAQSAFLDPPPSQILNDPPPDNSEQERILSAANGYLSAIIPKLPDFFATRNAIYFRGDPPREVAQAKETVLYRHGDEVVVNDKMQRTAGNRPPVKVGGTFGPLLNSLQAIFANRSVLTWERWERGGTGSLAVFSYENPGTPLVTLSECCYPNNPGPAPVIHISAPSHLEVAVDPRDGAIFRVSVEDRLANFVPIKRSDVMVNYGPVTIRGKTFILPLYSVAIDRLRSTERFEPDWKQFSFAAWGPYETRMSIFTFDHYHNFRGEARILY